MYYRKVTAIDENGLTYEYVVTFTNKKACDCTESMLAKKYATYTYTVITEAEYNDFIRNDSNNPSQPMI